MAANNLGAEMICGAAYEISKVSENRSCILLFYGTAFEKSPTETFDYVMWYILPIVLTIGSVYYLIKESVIHIHRFLQSEKEKVILKLHSVKRTSE